MRQSYDVRVEGKDVTLGNVAFLRCVISEHVKEFVTVSSWQRGDEILVPGVLEIGKLFHIFFFYSLQLKFMGY